MVLVADGVTLTRFASDCRILFNEAQRAGLPAFQLERAIYAHGDHKRVTEIDSAGAKTWPSS